MTLTALEHPPKVLAFDVFGTVVDWRGSVIREVAALATAKGRTIDGAAFADAWRAGYQPAMHRVRTGALPWLRIDALHRLILDGLVDRFGIGMLDDGERTRLNRVWHRLDPWSDSVRGIALLKRRFVVTTLSNGNFSLLTELAKHAGLPWDCIVSAELFRHYKPDPETYLGTADLLGVAPDELMLVACHPADLRAAAEAGLRTAYVVRPLENGPDAAPPLVLTGEFDVMATDFVDLARQFGIDDDRPVDFDPGSRTDAG
jgi:2-haloacid dehalogenase